MPAAHSDNTDDIRIAIMRLSRRLRAERVSEDVSDSQLSALFALWKLGPQSLGSLSEHERVTPPSANRTVNALVEAGLAVRSGAPDDGRKVLITATEAGIDLIEQTKIRRAAWFAERLSGLTAEERQIVDRAAPILRELADS